MPATPQRASAPGDDTPKPRARRRPAPPGRPQRTKTHKLRGRVLPTSQRDAEVIVSLLDTGGRHEFDMRVFSRRHGSWAFLPTRRGLCLDIETLPGLIAFLQAAQAKAASLGWLEPSAS